MGLTLSSAIRLIASWLGSDPKAKISALQVADSEISLSDIYPTSDFKILTVMLCLVLILSVRASSCSCIVSSMPLSENFNITLKLLTFSPIFTKNWYTYSL